MDIPFQKIIAEMVSDRYKLENDLQLKATIVTDQALRNRY